MAEGTRLKSMEEQIKRQDNKIQELVEKVQLKIDEHSKDSSSKMESFMAGIDAKLSAMMKVITKERGVVQISEGTGSIDRTPLLPTPVAKSKDEGEGKKWNFHVYPRVELHVFEGDHPRNWIRKCEKFFLIHQILDHQRMEVIEMYLEGRVDNWYQGIKLSKGKLDWDEFVELLCHRFDETNGVDIVEEFNKLQQEGTVRDYQEKFEELKTRMLVKDKRLPESYFISSFVSGLKEDIKPVIKMLRPESLLEAYEIAVLQEQSLELSSKKSKAMVKTLSPWQKPTMHSTPARSGVLHKGKEAENGENKKISAQEI